MHCHFFVHTPTPARREKPNVERAIVAITDECKEPKFLAENVCIIHTGAMVKFTPIANAIEQSAATSQTLLRGTNRAKET